MKHSFRVTRQMRSKSTLVAAKAYISQGLKVIVLHGIDDNGHCTCKNTNCNSPGKHPLGKFFPSGLKDATLDIALVRKALRIHKDANLAITLEGLTVADTDGPTGRKTVQKLKLPNTIKVKTGRGYHRYFDGVIETGSFKCQQLDVLTGSSRMVVVPPSRHPTGKYYHFSRSSASSLATLPQSLKKLRSTLKTREDVTNPKLGSSLSIRNGERNDALFKAALHLRRRIDDEDAIQQMISVLNDNFTETPLDHKELLALLNSSTHYIDDTFEMFGPPKTTEPLPMDWLWYPYIPYFGVTILAGDPGKGKSLITAMLIAAITTGGPWPLSTEPAPKGKVLLLSAEDSWARVTLNRLLKNGADISNIRTMHKFQALTPENLDKLEQYVAEEKPRLIVIDTLAAYLGNGRDMNKQNEVGEFLGRLNEIADEHHCAVLAIGHLNKQSNEHPLYRIVGSIGFVASIRSALFYGTNPQDRSQYALAHGKANSSVEGDTLVFEKTGGGRNDVPLLHAVGKVDANPYEVCKVETNAVGRPPSTSESAREHILELLGEKPMPWKNIEAHIERRSIASIGTLNILRAEMAKCGDIVQVGRGRAAEWTLGKTPNDK